MKEDAQAMLEFVLVFVIMIALFMGLLGLWQWSSDNIIMRQQRYNATRLPAGSSSPGEPSASGLFQATPITDSQTYVF